MKHRQMKSLLNVHIIKKDTTEQMCTIHFKSMTVWPVEIAYNET